MSKVILYRLECLPEDTQIEGNVLASGDDAEDKRAEQFVYAQLQWTPWAWCCVRVVAFIPGIDLEGDDYLGCCSYTSEEDFKQGGYYEAMCDRAKADLMAKIAAVKAIEVQS